MSNGGYKGNTPARETSPEQYPGVWELTEQFQAQADGNWPFQETDCAPRSLRFNASDNSYLSKTPASAGNRKTWTWSAWVKRSGIGANDNLFRVAGSSSKATQFSITIHNGNYVSIDYGGAFYLRSTRLLRDPSAWQHWVVSVDTTNSTANNRIRLYINGVEETEFDTRNNPDQNEDLGINRASEHTISSNDSNGLDGYLADVHFIDGQALSCEEFGFFDGAGIWQPKRFTGDYASGAVYSNSTDLSLTYADGPAGMFDGSLSTRGGAPSTNQTYVKLFDNASIPCSTGIRIYWNGVGSGQRYIRINDTTVLDDGSNSLTPGWSTASSFSGTINKLEVQNGSSGSWSLSAIEVDGQILTDASVGRNSFHLDFADNSSNAALGTDTSGNSNTWTVNNLTAASSQVYSNNITTTGNGGSWYPSYPATNIFDSTTTNYGHANGDGSVTCVVTFSLSPTVTANSSVSVYGGMTNPGTAEISINGGTAVALTSGSSATTKTTISFSGAISSIVITKTSSDAAGLLIYGFEIDGVRLTDGDLSSSIDSLVDSPTNDTQTDTGAGGEVVGNYCTWNPLAIGSNLTSENGNLDIRPTSNNWLQVKATFSVSSGKWYWESTVNPSTSYVNQYHGISDFNESPNTNLGTVSGYCYGAGGDKYTAGTNAGGAGASYGAGDTIGMALDLDSATKTITYYKNGVQQFSQNITGSGPWHPASNCYYNQSMPVFSTNFGQRAFAYQNAGTNRPSADYKSLNTANLPEPTIADGSAYFTSVKYAGNSGDGLSTTQDVTTTFSPDLVWIKDRTGTNSNHLFDTIRGAGKRLLSNSTSAEGDVISTLSAFNNDGFTVNGNNAVNDVGSNYISWNWDAGDATTTIAAGGLNSSLYNQSQTWSSGTQSGNAPWGSSSWDYVFNGVIPSTFDQSNLVYQVASGGVFTFSSAISGRIQVYAALGSSGYFSGNTIVLSDGSSQEVTNGNSNFVLYDFGTKSNITSITLNGAGTSSGLGVPGILLDGKLLVDAGVSITTPSIPSTVRANPSAGFSIVTFSSGSSDGDFSCGHGLNAAPELIFMKSRSRSGGPWWVYHASVTDATTKYLQLSEISPLVTNSGGNIWGSSLPTSSVFGFSVGAGKAHTQSETVVSYCFAPIEGYSSFGSYENPSSSEGAFVFLGFKPALLIIKCALQGTSSSGLGDWIIKDSTRSPFNNPSDGNTLVANVNNAEDSYYNPGQAAIDFLSNGFKIRHPNSSPAGDPGRIYIYAAWAESPFKTARAQ